MKQPTLSYITELEIKMATVANNTLKLPDLKIGETILVGKFKNRKAVIEGFSTDKNGHPVVKTDKGEFQVFKFRLTKLLP